MSSEAGEADQSAEATLVDRLRAGDADAFAEIVRAWSPMMLHVARAYVSTDASAQEVVQEAWLALIRGIDKFEGRSLLRTWMVAVVSNIGRSRGAQEARIIPWSSLGPSADEGAAVDPDRFRGLDDSGRGTGHLWVNRGHGRGQLKRRRWQRRVLASSPMAWLSCPNGNGSW